MQFLVFGEFLARQLLHVGVFFVGEHVLSLLDSVKTSDVFLLRLHDVLKVLILLRELDVALLVGDYGRIGDERAYLLEPCLKSIEFL